MLLVPDKWQSRVVVEKEEASKWQYWSPAEFLQGSVSLAGVNRM